MVLDARSSQLKMAGGYKNNPANIYLFKVNNGNTRKKCEI